VGVRLIHQKVEADWAKGKVSYGDAFSCNILATIGFNSLLDGSYPTWYHLKPIFLEDCLFLLIGLKVELEVGSKIVFNGVNSRIYFPSKLVVIGVVTIDTAEVSEDSPWLDEALALRCFEHRYLAELKLTFISKLSQDVIIAHVNVLVSDLAMWEKETDWLSTTIDIEIVEL
jgi:hypothetical protein